MDEKDSELKPMEPGRPSRFLALVQENGGTRLDLFLATELALSRAQVRGQLDERKRLISLQLKEYSSFDEALAATDAFMAEHAPRLATTHWMRHQAST